MHFKQTFLDSMFGKKKNYYFFSKISQFFLNHTLYVTMNGESEKC